VLVPDLKDSSRDLGVCVRTGQQVQHLGCADVGIDSPPPSKHLLENLERVVVGDVHGGGM
jgi:hypothetical protein